MIAGLDSSFDRPTPAIADQAYIAGVRLWIGYLATQANVGLASPWDRQSFEDARRCGATPIAMASGWDNASNLRRLAAQWNVRLCLDCEGGGLRDFGDWTQGWLDASGAGIYGTASVHRVNAAFHILADYPGSDPGATWRSNPPASPHGWQWRGTHTEFGLSVDRGWYDDWFLQGGNPMGYPVIDGPSWISQGYGCTDYSGEWVVPQTQCASGHFHTGIDLAANCGLPIWAVRAGTVVRIGIEYLGPYAVGVRDDEGLFHVYGHCSGTRVAVGQVVETGDWIANVDTLGASTGCHLHYAVRTDGAFEAPNNTVNPVPLLEEFMALVDEVREMRGVVGQIWNALYWANTGHMGPVVDTVGQQSGEIHNLLNWGTPVGGAVPQGWMPTQLAQVLKDVEAIKTKVGA